MCRNRQKYGACNETPEMYQLLDELLGVKARGEAVAM